MKLKKKKIIGCALIFCTLILSAASGVTASAATMSQADGKIAVASANYGIQSQALNTEEATVASARSLPAGAYRMNVNINGRDVLKNKVFGIGSTTYVPLFKFCDWLGVFSYSYNKNTHTATVKGDKLEINAREGMLYIVANGRYFYTADKVLNVNGEIYVPIRTITKALNSRVVWSNEDNEFKVYSGDTSRLKTAAQVYREDEVYWLSRIINAEAGGEPMKGKLAVGNVILNRVRSSAFPNTIYSVIFDRKNGLQFAPVGNGSIYKTPNADSIIAAKMCLEGYSLSTEVLYFFNPKTSPVNWISQNRKYAFTVNNHAFYY